MKKELKAIICVVLSVWFFVMGFEVGIYRERKTSQTLVPVQTVSDGESGSSQTQIPSTTEPTTAYEFPTEPTSMFVFTTAPTTENKITTELPTVPSSAIQPTFATTTRPPETTDVSRLTKAQIVQRVGSAVNALKREKNFKARKVENKTITIVDCSVPQAVNLLNNFIKGIAGEETANYNFVNGQATGYDDNGKAIKDEGIVTPKDVIPPCGKDFTLPESGVVKATAVREGSNIVYTLKLVEESTTFANTVPKFASQAVGYLDLTAIKVSGLTITDANMSYSSTTVTVTVNKDSKVVSIHNYVPMNGNGTAKMGFVSGNAVLDGADDEYWEFSY